MRGETVTVLTAGSATDPDSGETYPDWSAATASTVENVLLGWLPSEPLLTVTGVVTVRATMYFQILPLVPLAGTRIRIRDTTYEVLGEPADWRMGTRRNLEVPVRDILSARRTAAERLMVDTCKVEHPTGASTTSDAGAVVLTYATIYTGRCRVELVGAGSTALREVGDQQASVLSIQVQLPIDGSEGIHVRDRVTILRASNDSDLLGRVFRVSQPAPSSDAAARLLPCVEVTA